MSCSSLAGGWEFKPQLCDFCFSRPLGSQGCGTQVSCAIPPAPGRQEAQWASWGHHRDEGKACTLDPSAT